jgi:hypothetical protein
MMETTLVPLAKIRTDGGTQMRAEINDETVSEYAERYRADGKMPPLVVFYDGTEYWLADGFHRLHALRAANKPQAIAEVRSGSQRDAVLFACGANSGHGLRRTNADKRRAVETMLRDEEWCGWTDSRIARQCGVSQPFVGSVRASYNGYKMESEAPRLVERSGKVYEQNTANIGKRKRHEQTEAPAPYREGCAPERKEQIEERQIDPPVVPPPPPPPVKPTVPEKPNYNSPAVVSAIALSGMIDRIDVSIREQLHHFSEPLDQTTAERLRTSLNRHTALLAELRTASGVSQ